MFSHRCLYYHNQAAQFREIHAKIWKYYILDFLQHIMVTRFIELRNQPLELTL